MADFDMDQDAGDEDGGDSRRAHRCAEAAHHYHQEGDQPRFTATSRGGQPVAESPRYARSHKAVANHE